jgi:hypothetical protein
MYQILQLLSWQTWTLIVFLIRLTSLHAQTVPSHGIYLDNDWIATNKDELKISALHEKLASAGVLYIYVQIKNMKSPDVETQTARLMMQTKARNPALRIVAFLGRRVCSGLKNVACLELTSEKDTHRLQLQVEQLWQLGYDGVQLDLEPVTSGDKAFLALLDGILSRQPAGKLLSVAGYMLEPTRAILNRVRITPRNGATPFYWSHDYYREVLSRVDSVVMMNYDTGIQSSSEYEQWTIYQIVELLRIRSSVGDKLIHLGIPAYKYGRRGLFNAQAESAIVALDAARKVLGRFCPAAVGFAPYHESEMTQELWTALARYTVWDAHRCRRPGP